MGIRPTSPASFKKEFARRLRAARQLKYEQAVDFARDLGLAANTYGKYESGRTLLPHHLIAPAADLLGVDIKVFFEFEKKAVKKAG